MLLAAKMATMTSLTWDKRMKLQAGPNLANLEDRLSKKTNQRIMQPNWKLKKN